MSNMKICGLSGTDFRPVFNYVDWLQTASAPSLPRIRTM